MKWRKKSEIHFVNILRIDLACDMQRRDGALWYFWHSARQMCIERELCASCAHHEYIRFNCDRFECSALSLSLPLSLGEVSSLNFLRSQSAVLAFTGVDRISTATESIQCSVRKMRDEIWDEYSRK